MMMMMMHCFVTRAICTFVRICMGKITIVSVAYENVGTGLLPLYIIYRFRPA